MGLHSASAQVTWDGGASTNNWLDANNWSGNAVPSGTLSSGLTVGTGAAVQLAGSAPNVSGNLTLSGNSSLEVQSGGGLNIGNGDLTVNAGSTLTISGGAVTYRRLLNSAGKLVITGGSFNSAFNASTGYFAAVDISGGTWNSNQSSGNALSLGTSGLSNIKISGSGSVVAKETVLAGSSSSAGRAANITMTGGSFSAKVFQQVRGTVNVAGGSFSTGANYAWTDTATAGADKVFQITGGLGTVNIGGNFVTTGSSGNRKFVLTAQNSGVAQENISILHVAGTDSAGGNVNVALQGGVLLGSPTTYTLIDAGTLSGSINYIGSNVYTGQAVGNQYQIALNAAQDKGDLAVSGAAPIADEAFTLSSTGYVNLDLSSVIDDPTLSLLVRLDANAGAKSLTDMVTFLSQSGYSDVTLDSFGDYDISFTIDHNFLSSGSMYFGWDFSQFDATAGLTGVQIVSSVPEPGTVGLLSIAGLSLVLWRRRW